MCARGETLGHDAVRVDRTESDSGRGARSRAAQHAAHDHSNEALRSLARGSLGNNEGLGAGEDHVEQDGGTTAVVVAVWSDRFRTWHGGVEGDAESVRDACWS